MIDTLDAWQLLAIAGAGLVAGFINVVAGGGSLLVIPLLVFLGLPAGTANGTARVAIFVQNAVASATYLRGGKLDLSLTRRMLAPALLGALAGSLLGAHMADASMRVLLGWVMLGCAALVVWNPRPRQQTQSLSPLRVWPLLFVIGLYGGLVQAGVGYLILAGLMFVLGLPLAQANVQKVVLVFAYTPIALVTFFAQDKVDLALGGVLALGQALGAWLGAVAALRRGERLIRALLLVVVVASGFKLLLE